MPSEYIQHPGKDEGMPHDKSQNGTSPGPAASRRYFDWLVRAIRKDQQERVIPAIRAQNERSRRFVMALAPVSLTTKETS